MTVCTDIADYEWLTGDEGCALLIELANDDAPLHRSVARLRGRFSPERTHLLIEQVELRRRAAAKFAEPDRMFFTRLGLEQSTDQWVAAHKARRFASQPMRSASAVADLCCGIGGDLIAFAAHGAAVGVDYDPVAALFSAINAGAATRVANVRQFDLGDFAAWHIDPDRRPDGRRTTSLECCQPDLADIERLLARVAHAAIKLAPATNVPDAWVECCELEWISRDRECRQLVAWSGDLAHSPGRRRATVLPTASDADARTITGRPSHSIPIVEQADRYLFDVDAAVLAARLKGALAAEHGLFALGAGSTYLTGPHSVDDAALACFEVDEVMPMQPRRIASYLRQRGIGRLEVKKRGVNIDPEQLRRALKLRGDHAATLLITPVAARPAAILARRYSPHGTSAKINPSR